MWRTVKNIKSAGFLQILTPFLAAAAAWKLKEKSLSLTKLSKSVSEKKHEHDRDVRFFKEPITMLDFLNYSPRRSIYPWISTVKIETASHRLRREKNLNTFFRLLVGKKRRRKKRGKWFGIRFNFMEIRFLNTPGSFCSCSLSSTRSIFFLLQWGKFSSEYIAKAKSGKGKYVHTENRG